MTGTDKGRTPQSTHSLTAPAGPAIVTDVQRLLERVWRSQPAVVEAERTRFSSAVVEVVGALAAIRATAPGRSTMTVLVSCDPSRLSADVRGDGAPGSADTDDAVDLPEGLVYERSPGGNRWRVTCVRHP